ncbi:MAG: tRNA (adenosine(37)-N6)-dimethylallyltransferase MiaA [Bacteroidetes bacterium]|nr:MAG: tRNA (adenosine(37)-N6)-dimethylallyltransferase MiaA [Bacteroidota bacterium]
MNTNMTKVIIILGPTASGKTEASVELSKLIDCEVISADSRQIYRFLDIGTAKPTKEAQKQVKHHFIDILNPDEYYSAGLFGSQAESVISDLSGKKKIPLIVGGSGLYIKALCEGLFREDLKNNTSDIRKNITNKLELFGIDVLYDELKKIDVESTNLYFDRNPRRILRALEYFYSTGFPISKAHKEKKDRKTFKTLYFGIHFEREELYKRINTRAELMWENGLESETRKVLKIGYTPELNSLNTVGYKECIAYLNSDISRERAIELTKQNTRRYAKRQMTWFRKINDIKWLNGGDSKKIAEQILSYVSGIIPDTVT